MATYKLPQHATPFIGRELELAETMKLLSDDECCLLTLIGLGGIGKTRLAIELASQQAEAFEDGVYWVSLQSLQTKEQLLPAIISALSLNLSEDPLQQLQDYLSEKCLLLLLDNFEQFLSNARILSDILISAQHVKIIITSREPLGIRQEWVYRVKGLDIPGEHVSSDIATCSAVQLFTYHARRIWWQFSPLEEAEAINRICQLVEGMPLALEMAAGWLKVLSCQDIVHEIQRNLDFLKSASFDLPDRQHSIRAVFQQSWALLSKQGQESFQKLAVFRAGFTRDAAETVAGLTLQSLIELADKSFIRKTTAGRFEMHELLRQFAQELLEAQAIADDTKAAHSTYYLQHLKDQESSLKSQHQLQTLDEIDADFENIRAAWEWAVELKKFDALEAGFETLGWYCAMRSRYAEGMILYRLAREKIEPSTNKPVRLAYRLLLPLPFHGGSRNAEDQLRIQRALTLARKHNDPFYQAYCLYELAVANPSEALELLESSIQIFRDLNVPFYEAVVLQELAFTYTAHANHEKARMASDEAITLARQHENQFVLAWAVGSQAWAALLAGRYDVALRHFSQKQALHDEQGDAGAATLCMIQTSLFDHFMAGEFDRARTCAEDGLQFAHEINYPPPITWARLLLGLIACVDEEYVGALRYFNNVGTEMVYIQGIRLSGLALAAFGNDDHAAAIEAVCEVLQLALDKDGPGWMAWALPASALIVANRNDYKYAAKLLGFLFSSDVMKPDWLERFPLIVRLQSRLRHQLGTAYFTHFDNGSELDPGKIAEDTLRLLCVTTDPYWDANLKLDNPLTRAEFDILHLIATGKTDKQISELRHVSLGTIRGQNHETYGKLGVDNRNSAVAKGREFGILP